MDEFGIGVFRPMADIIRIVRERLNLGGTHVVYKNMYSIYEGGYVTFKHGAGQNSSTAWAITSAGSEEAEILRGMGNSSARNDRPEHFNPDGLPE
jgi:hypothetical protein